jgi:hypothetical protein
LKESVTPGAYGPECRDAGITGIRHWCYEWIASRTQGLELLMANEKGPNIKKKQKCKNCEGKGLLKKGDKVVKCQRCGGTGFR